MSLNLDMILGLKLSSCVSVIELGFVFESAFGFAFEFGFWPECGLEL